MIDPRSKNELFDLTSIGQYFDQYRARLQAALSDVDLEALDKARKAIEFSSASGGHVYAIGNGGSASICDHLCCDWTKGTSAPGFAAVKTHSLVANVALFSAIANDFSYENVFVQQVKYYMKPGDTLVAISSSGNSENIVRAVTAARALGAVSIGLSGFSGGRLREAADVSIHVPVNNYGIVEDAHQLVMHVLGQFIAGVRDSAAKAIV